MEKQSNTKRTLNPAHRMTLTYVISLTIIAALCVFIHFTLDKIIVEQRVSSNLINVSGQQRMLSQRIILYTNEYIEKNTFTDKEQALKALSEMQANHQYLLKEHFKALQKNQASPLSVSMKTLYFSEPHNVDQKITEFTLLIKQILNDSNTQNGIQESTQNLTFLSLSRDQILTPCATLNTDHMFELQGFIFK
jgi:hypothetical protein